jgi:curved DNA-binding protein CbpA
MRSKNYYKTLGVETTATTEEIRKAYRKLALRHHPDKNNGDELSAAHFKEIHEAYHILSDPHRRSAYNQKTWFHKHGLNRQGQQLTSYVIFTKTNELKLFLQRLRPSEINKPALTHYIKHLLSERSIKILKQSSDYAMNREIVLTLLKATEPLTAVDTSAIATRLKSIADQETMVMINKKLQEISVQLFWERYQFLIIIIITLLICLVIFLISS